ncbi:MAG: hypothetical protein ACSNEK_07530 [Parachlamydiaceae bacterium]
MEAIWLAIIYTPLWVYALLIALIINGVQSARKRVVSLFKLAILPGIFSCLTIQSLFSLPLTGSLIAVFFISAFCGGLVGWKQVEMVRIRAIPPRFLIEIPGSWKTLVISLFIFSIKYGFAYALYQNPILLENTAFVYCMTMSSGFFTSFFVGRVLCYFNRYVQIAFAQ